MARADDAPTLAAVAAPGGADRPAAAAATDERPLTAVVLPHLLGRGTMLTGAKELLESAPPATVWVHPDSVPDGVADGSVVAVRGPAGSLELPVRITTAVARGVVVVPANSTTDPAGALRDGAGPLHVALEPVAAAAAEEGSA